MRPQKSTFQFVKFHNQLGALSANVIHSLTIAYISYFLDYPQFPSLVL